MDVVGRLAHVSCKALWEFLGGESSRGLAFVTEGNSVLLKFLSMVSHWREESSLQSNT